MRYLAHILITLMMITASAYSTAQCGGPVPKLCDADGDFDVDSDDIAAIGLAKGTPSSGPGDMRDVDGDGMITVLDARKCVAKCDRDQCKESKFEEVGELVEYPGPPPVDPEILNQLPKDPDTGLPLLAENSGVKVLVNLEKRNAISGLGACTHWITSCLSPTEDRSLDDCARSAPRCTTNQPWLESTVCCPVACFQQYSEQRLSGIDPITALIDVYGREGSCYPGFRELLD